MPPDKKTGKPPEKMCFVIMPFTERENSEYEENHFYNVYQDLFVPAIEAAGYTPFRVDEDFCSTQIMAKVVDCLATAPMALCDLSGGNPNVLYELGIRHAFNMPVVLAHEEGSKHFFDIAGLATLAYSPALRYRQVIKDQRKITRAIIDTARGMVNASIIDITKVEKAKKEELYNPPEDQRDLTLQAILQDLEHIKSSLGNPTPKPKRPQQPQAASNSAAADIATPITSNRSEFPRLEFEIIQRLGWCKEYAVNPNTCGMTKDDITKTLTEIENLLQTCEALRHTMDHELRLDHFKQRYRDTKDMIDYL